MFSLESGSNFDIFGYLKISTLLDVQKPRFWLHFGSQVGLPNRSCWPQEPLGTRNKLFFEPLNFHPKEDPTKTAKKDGKNNFFAWEREAR